MEFAGELLRWEFKGREKRFFMYGLENAEIAHCPNTGSLKGVLDNCARIWVRDHGANSGRKLQYTAELCELKDGSLVGINTLRANALAVEALQAGLIPEVGEPGEIKVEAKWDAGTRFDLKFGAWWGEVKNTTLAEGTVAMFPDAKTERGLKHLQLLRQIAAKGGKALQIYIVPRLDVQTFSPADAIDPLYGAALRAAVDSGVVVAALGCKVTSQGIWVDRRLPVVL
ncbi:MAG: DNA/RNA nuclease SfsA [Proteobacteria bacterium]|nr:DNA/RNA nuclease SfsA [Pseudomonadota bacterium]